MGRHRRPLLIIDFYRACRVQRLSGTVPLRKSCGFLLVNECQALNYWPSLCIYRAGGARRQIVPGSH